MTETQTEVTTHPYEVMFLVSQQEATNLGGVIEHLDLIFERAGATCIAMRKWDERRLAYEVDKQKRGVYILCYIEADPQRIQSIERDVNLSEQVMRAMVLRADHYPADYMQGADARQDLMAEAKMRADRALEGEEKRSTVALGAPPKREEAAPAPAEEGAAPEGDAPAAPEGDAPAEGGEPAPTE